MGDERINEEGREVKKDTTTVERFKRELLIPVDAEVTHNQPGTEVKFLTPTIHLVVGIGKDHHADLIMDTDAFNAFNEGAEVRVYKFEGE